MSPNDRVRRSGIGQSDSRLAESICCSHTDPKTSLPNKLHLEVYSFEPLFESHLSTDTHTILETGPDGSL